MVGRPVVRKPDGALVVCVCVCVCVSVEGGGNLQAARFELRANVPEIKVPKH